MNDDVPFDANTDKVPAWFRERVEVQIKSTGRLGFIREITGHNSAAVNVDGALVILNVSDLSATNVNGKIFSDWFKKYSRVRIKSSGCSGVIEEIVGYNSAAVNVNGVVTTFDISDLSGMAPKEHDMVRVIAGPEVGFEGELVCVDGEDAILRDAKEDFKIVDLSNLVKIR